MFEIVTAVLLLVIGTNCVYSQDLEPPRTCLSILDEPADTLEHCSFENSDDSKQTVRCDLLDQIQDHEGEIDHFFFLHVRFMFNVIEPLNSSIACLSISSLFIDRVTDKKPWENATIGDLTTNFYTLLRYVNFGFLKTDFNNTVYPAAILEMNDDCQQENSSCNPIQRVRFLKELKRPAWSADLFNDLYWESIKKWYYTLGGYNTEFQLDFDKKFGVIKPKYLSGIFQGLNMVYLRLTGGNWGHLNNTLLRSMKTLRILDLSDNAINSISDETFLGTSDLEVLILADNSLQELPTGIQILTHLRQLDLSSNPIKMETGLNNIVRLSSLKELNLAHIRLNDLNSLKPLLSSCKMELQLAVLNLSHCGIQSVSSDDFNCQKELRVLDLSYNKLKEIPSEIVLTQKYLEVLNISNNILTKSPQFLLHGNVNALDISDNRLYDASDIIQTGTVKFLDLSGNNISVWSNENMFKDHVKNLNLSRNSISFLSKEMIASLKTLDSVDLGENSYDCVNCNLPEFQNWLRTENVTKIYNLGYEDPLVCTLPAADRKKFIVDIEFDETLCLTNYPLVVGVPITVVFLIVAMTMGVIYFYRFEITYLMHLVNIKKSSAKRDNYTEAYKYDAFVCYSGPDRAWVIGELMPTLESKPDKYRLCLHERDFPLGSFISQNIVSSLQTSRFTIVVLTNNFIKSEWCRWELELANHKLFEDNREFLILIELEKLDRSSLPRHLKYLMDTRTYLEWPQNNENVERTWRRLKEALGPSMYQRQSERVKDHRHSIRESEIPLTESQTMIVNI